MVAVVVGAVLGPWQAVAMIGWDVAALTWAGWVWLTVGRLGPEATAEMATAQDPSRTAADLSLIIASVVSLVAVAVGIVKSTDVKGVEQVVLLTSATVSIVSSWLVVQTVYALRYAGLYYAGPDGGVEFKGEDKPCYTDFAYLAFTVGMTFQVSDTDLTSREMRRAALHHALLSYLFGTVIVATTINLVAGLVR